MTNEELQAIRERAEQASPAPWFLLEDRTLWSGTGETDETGDAFTDETVLIGEVAIQDNREQDSDFLIHVREDMAALLAEVEDLNETVRTFLNEAHEQRQKATAYRPFVRALALYEPHRSPFACDFCGYMDAHLPTCPVKEARALLASEGGQP